MEDFETRSSLGIGNGVVLAKFRRLESGMEDFETRSSLGIGNGVVLAKFRRLESEIEEFKLSSRLGIGIGGVRAKFEAWKRKCRSSSKVRGFQSEMEEFEPSFEALESGMEEFERSSRLGIGNEGV